MDLFNLQLRLAANMLHTVPKIGVTTMELRVLKALHGVDSIVGLESKGSVDRSERDELFRLGRQYGREKVEKIFNTVLDDFDGWLIEQLEAEEQLKLEKAQLRAAEEEQRKHATLATVVGAAVAAAQAPKPDAVSAEAAA